MSLMPEISFNKKLNERVSIGLILHPELAYFRGHFPGLPILPGVVQVDWAIRLAKQEFPELPVERFSGLKALKFLSPILPGSVLSLELVWHAETSRLDFAYESNGKKVGTGQALFTSGADL